MSAKIIVFANQKGGVGKTTLCRQAAYEFAVRRKHRVLVIDGDSQGSLTSSLLQTGVQSFFAKPPAIRGTSTDMLFADKLSVIIPTRTNHRHLDLIPVDKRKINSMYKVSRLSLKAAHNPARHLAKIAPHYDYIFVDTPPSVGTLFMGWMLFAHYLVCPLTLSLYALQGLQDLLSTVAQAKKDNTQLETLGFVINNFNGSGPQKALLENLRSALGEKIFHTVLRSRAPVETSALGLPLWEVRQSQPAVEEFSRLWSEMLQRVKTTDEAENAR